MAAVRCVRSVPFAEQRDAVRRAVRGLVEAHGGRAVGYAQGGVQVALPRDWPALDAALGEAGLEMAPGGLLLAPPGCLWHGRWLYAHYRVEG